MQPFVPPPLPGRSATRPSPPAKRILAVASGKGGVGKSTVALNVAAELARRGSSVGLLDADVYGPDIAVMTGVTRRVPAKQWTLSRLGGTPFAPVERHGVHIVSTGLMFGEDQALNWPAEMIGVLLNQLLWSPTWPKLNYLVVDLPPGTADVTQLVFRHLLTARALIVVTPQEVAHLDARKLIAMLGTANASILGGVENMSGFLCPCCGKTSPLFPPVDPARSIWETGVPLLGSVPLDPAPVDNGVPVVLDRPDSAHAVALRSLTDAIVAAWPS